MSFTLLTTVACIALFIAMLLAFELGRWLGRRRASSGASVGTSAVETTLFGLLGLLVAFTFYGAADRFDDRRKLIIAETNAIGTAYLRLDLLQAEDRAPLVIDFRDYLDARLAVYDKLPDVTAARIELARAGTIQDQIWKRAVTATADLPAPARMLLLPALNTMFDLANERTLTAGIHPPAPIFTMLGALVLVTGVLAGYGMSAARRSWIHILGLASVTAMIVFVILNLEYPRLGVIPIDGFDRALVELREKLQSAPAASAAR